MGYYSDVALCLKNRDLKELFEEMEGVPERERLIKIAKVEKIEDFTVFQWDNIKWYDDLFDELIWLKSFYQKREYVFLRLGEEPSDYEKICQDTDESYHMSIYLSVSQSIIVV
ncbi:MAG: hypothetical protein KH297_04720 [Firmicutes bacterium]|nr:hypothetical protein [Bacillota bacterium]